MTTPNTKSAVGQMKRTLFAAVLVGALLMCGSALAVQVWVPDSMSGIVGDTVLVPILVSAQVADSVIAADITLDFGESVLTATSSFAIGNAAPGWTAFVNPFPCSLLVAMAGQNPLAAGDTLLVVKMLVDSADTTTVWFSRCRLNEGNVPCTAFPGVFYGYTVGLEERGTVASAERILSLHPSLVQGRAVIRCCLDRSAFARLEIRDIKGDVVRTLFDGIAQPGEVRVEWNCEDNQGKRVPAGVYFCTLNSENQRSSLKVVLTQ
jgi:hypothetical protein